MNTFITVFFSLFLFFNLCRMGMTEKRAEPTTNTHTCADSTHALCDGGCECDGFECE